jgi:UDP-N-acetylenolpyruvoylglucosamine reductase
MISTAGKMDGKTGRGQQLAADLSALLIDGAVIRANEPLAKRTTFRVGGPADVYVEPASDVDLASVLDYCARRGEKFFVLGRGSNLLVRDGGFRGVVICLAQAHFSRVEIAGDRVWCGAGAKLKQIAVEARRHGLSGVEFLEGIPGSVGGALRMNAGAMGGATFDAVESVRFMNQLGQIFEKPARDIPVEYRVCPLLKDHIALDVVFRCAFAPREEIEKRMNAFNQKRWAAQPAAPSAGCVFKNPKTVAAGRLVDELGLKGLRVGGAVVSPEHGNFIVNDGNATARDILALIELIKQRAQSERGIELQTEVEIIGED